MKRTTLFIASLLFLLPILVQAQSTSWIGGTSDKWRTASNWTNGVPDDTKDVIIGDANFTGPNQPQLEAKKGIGECKSLSIGNGAATTFFDCNDELVILGDLIIGANGTFSHNERDLRLQGDFINSGTFIETSTKSVKLSGAAQIIGGSATTTFEKLEIEAGSEVTLAVDVEVNNTLTCKGLIDPTPDYAISGSAEIKLSGTGTLRVKASTFAGNYSHSGGLDIKGNFVKIDYASSTLDQTIESSITYKILAISGGMTKYPEGNLSIQRELFIEGGTMDLLSFTADRSNNGGNISISLGASLRIGGTNTFPDNYSSHFLAPTSTVEYYGANQTVSDEEYGNLVLSSSGGTITKTMPSTALNISGSLSSEASAGTLSFTAGNTISVLGNIAIGTSTTFDGSVYSHDTSGDINVEGNFTGSSGTLTSNGAGSMWDGAGMFNLGNLVISGNATSLNQNSSLIVSGNFSTAGGGSFAHTAGGTGSIVMTGSSKVISGSNILFEDLSINGSATISTTSSFVVGGDLVVDGSMNATGGVITMSGTSATIAGSGTLQFASLIFTGTIATSVNMSVSGDLSVSGSFNASAGAITFNGTSSFSGDANLFDLTIDNASTLVMGGGSTISIAGDGLTVGTGSFDTTSNLPNTVNYNSTGAQVISFGVFDNLIVSNGNTKGSTGGINVNGDFTIGSSTTFNAGTFTHSVQGNLKNSGTFTKGSSTIQLTGTEDSEITGATSFHNLTINKGSTNTIMLENDIDVVDLGMTSGNMNTGSNSVTITSDRTGPGIIIGTIIRTHAYTTFTDYAFEGPNNTINFTAIVGTITSITITVDNDKISTFPYRESINREYEISVTGGTLYTATLRLHYDEVDLNGNDETSLTLWNDSGTTTWVELGSSANDATENWVEDSGLIDLENKWSLSDGFKVLSWNGSVSTSWTDPNNWTNTLGTPAPTPGSDEVAVIGDLTITNFPVVSTTAQAKTVIFEANTNSSLTIGSSGSLTAGNISGDWAAGAASHMMQVGAQNLIISSDLNLSEGVSGRAIDLSIGTGSISVGGTLVQSGDASIIFSDAGTMSVGGDFEYIDGTFTPGTGSVVYDGSQNQNIAGITYNDLTISKASGTAKIVSTTTVDGNLNITGGQLDVDADLDLNGNFDSSVGTTTNVSSATINIGGEWGNDGNFIPGSGTIIIDGTAAQTIEAGTYNNMIVNKPNNTLTLLGNLDINGDVAVQSGILEASTYNISRTTTGGSGTMSAGTTIRFGGPSLQFNNFTQVSLDPTSTIEFYTSSPRLIPPLNYGHLIISNGGSNAKTMLGASTVSGDLTVNTGASLVAPSTTLNLVGDFTMNGSFDANSGAVILDGTDKNINGNITFNDLIVNGGYDIQSGDQTFDGNIHVTSTGDFDAGSSTVVLHGDLTNENILFSSGILTFTGTRVQTIRILNALTSTSSGVINFNGTVEPIFNSNFASTLATMNLNNTGGLRTSVGFTVLIALNVASGVTWDAGPFNPTIRGHLNNQGTIICDGDILLSPIFFPVSINLGDYTSNGSTEFGGTMPISLTHNAQSFTSVTISNSHASGITPDENWTLSNDLLIAPGAVLNGGTALTHSIAGDWTNNGSFNSETSLFNFNGTDDQTIAGNSASSFQDLSIDKASGKVLIESSVNVIGTLDILTATELDADGLNAGGELTIVSDALGDGRIDELASGASITGDLTVQRFLPNTDADRYWRYVTSSVAGATVSDWQAETPITGTFINPSTQAEWPGVSGIAQNSPSMYRVNEPAGGTFDNRWESYPLDGTSSTAATLDQGRGYALYVRSTGTETLDQRGTAVTGDVGVSVTAQSVSDPDGWNLIGNPYPSSIDWDNVTIPAGVNDEIHFRDNANNAGTGSGSYVRYVGGVGTPVSFNGEIAMGQAFWVKATANATITFQEGSKTTSTGQFFKPGDPDDLLRIGIHSDVGYDETVVRFLVEATDNFDSQFDAGQLNVTSISISSLLDDGQLISINTLSQFKEEKTVRLAVTGMDPGQITLNFFGYESFLYPVDILLVDKFAKKTQNVIEIPIYTFDVSTDPDSFGSERFEIIFTPKRTITGIESETPHQIKMFPNPTNGLLNLEINTSDLTVLESNILDINGKVIRRIVFEKNSQSVRSQTDISDLVNGAYFVQVVSDEGIHIMKLIKY